MKELCRPHISQGI